MRKVIAGLIALAFVGICAPAAQELKTDQDKTIYALGTVIGRHVRDSIHDVSLDKNEQAIFMQGLHDILNDAKLKVDLSVYQTKIQDFAQARVSARADAQKAQAPAFLEKAAKAPGAVKTDSGLIYFEEKSGTGASPKPGDSVKVNYRGTLMDGTEFDSSYKTNTPLEFSLGQVIKCWTEGLQKMKVGGKSKFVCPASIAYGERGRGGIPGNAPLTFEVELLDVKAKPPAPPAGQPPTAGQKPPVGQKPPATAPPPTAK